MKALQLTASRRLVLADVPELAPPGPDESVVRISYVALNHIDVYGFRGMAFARRTLPITVGVEAAGVVEAVGSAGGAATGDRVVVYPADACAVCRNCQLGRHTMCLEPKVIMGFHTDGMAAERVTVKTRQLIPVPPGVALRDAACTPITLATVQRMLFDNARLASGETILVHAAGSGIGSVAIKMAKEAGATVIATVGSDAKLEKARAIGADHVINYTREAFHTRARRLTGGRGVDVVFEHVGEATWEGSLVALTKGGRLVTCGSTSGAHVKTNLLHCVNHQISILCSFGGTRSNVCESLDKLAAGKARPVIDSEVGIADVAAVMDRMERRDVFGKILVRGPAAAS
ncbi:MAG TPA: zinc-binding dehydrogenase [Kofleriaceae bacterium]|nr:zinc-binding dehydrogenase [Kofleriaceae bacterium]